MIFIGDPNLRKVEDEWIQISFVHIQKVSRNIITYNIVKNLST